MPEPTEDQSLDQFCRAVVEGHVLFAHSTTIAALKDRPDPRAKDLADKFEPNDYIEEGKMIAIRGRL